MILFFYVSSCIFSVGTKVLVATGNPGSAGRNTEIIDLEDATFECIKPNHFPISLGAANGGLIGTTPFVCGGSSCYALEENGEWKEDKTATLPTRIFYSAAGSVIIDDKLIIAGGQYGKNLAAIELLAPNTKPMTLPISLPEGMSGSCIVSWDSTTFMIIGGQSDRLGLIKETFFFNLDNNTMTNGPDLLVARRWLACHEIDVSGEEFIIVAGGHGGQAPQKTEVLAKSSFKDGWKYGKNFKQLSL